MDSSDSFETRFYTAVKRLFEHWSHDDCHECTYGDAGHCLTEEELRLQVWRMIRERETQNVKS